MFTFFLHVMETLQTYAVLPVNVPLGKYILLSLKRNVVFFCFRKSASCTHVSASLHALRALKPTTFNLQPDLPPAFNSSDDADAEVSVTSLPCQWKLPRKRKESTLRVSEATFEKHDYSKPVKRKVKHVEQFDPRPVEYRGSAMSRLPKLLENVKGEQLCVSLLFDPNCRKEHVEQPQDPLLYRVLDSTELKPTIAAFKNTLEVTQELAREIELNTREQRMSPLWFSVRRFRITASNFGAVLSRRPNTPPDSLVLRIIQPRNFSTAATKYGVENEQVAIQEYTKYQHSHGHPNLFVSPSGFHIDPDYPYLGASPDGSVYDPSDSQQPFGFLEVKCPYSVKQMSPVEACSSPGFFCVLDPVTCKPKLKESHPYFAQVQGQMGLGGRFWCDFVVYTEKCISIQRIPFNEAYWKNTLLPKLTSFYDNCVVPEIVSPVHHIGLPLRDLSK